MDQMGNLFGRAVDYPVPQYIVSRPTKGCDVPCLIRFVYKCAENCPNMRELVQENHRVSLLTRFLVNAEGEKIRYRVLRLDPFVLPKLDCPLAEIRIRLPFHLFVPDRDIPVAGGMCLIGRRVGGTEIRKHVGLKARLIDLTENVVRPVPELVITLPQLLVTAGYSFSFYGDPQLLPYEAYWPAE